MHETHYLDRVHEDNTTSWERAIEEGKTNDEIIACWIASIQFRRGAKCVKLRLPKKIAERLGVAPDVVLEGGVLRTTNGQELWRRS